MPRRPAVGARRADQATRTGLPTIATGGDPPGGVSL